MSSAAQSVGTFDIVIVGSGPAGCVLAHRLSANPALRVLLLEAGGRDLNPWIHIPIGYLYTRNKPGTDWCFSTAPEENLGHRTLPFPLGRVLGGCSSINGMLYVRGHASDYDAWRDRGNRGWGWQDVLPYFKKSENFRGAPTEVHGAGGPWDVEPRPYRWDVLDALLEAGESLGLPRNPDLNSGENHGLWFCQVNQRHGRRHSAASAFLRPVWHRPNLTVMTGAHVRRVCLDGRQATGVDFERSGRAHVALAREVVLAAGAVGSPVILQRSGIGAAAMLADLGIEPRHDLPGVGENFHDHMQMRLVFRLSNTRTMNERARSLLERIGMGAEYMVFRRGPLTYAPSQLGGHLRTRADEVAPDVQLLFQMGSLDAKGRFDRFPGISVAISNIRPQSRGHVRIRSAALTAPPVIKPNYLAAAADRAAIGPAIRAVRALMAAPAMARFAPKEVAPGAQVASDEDLIASAAQVGSSYFHPAGSCRMGDDAQAVVDNRLRVHGLSGLRVIDASIMPSVVSGNTNAATVMIAEKGADMMLQDIARS